MKEQYILSDGYAIPKIGFGTYQMYGFEATRRTEEALANGYRMIDTAYNYENEGAVGRAIKNSAVPRDQITIASKLPGAHHAYEEAIATIQESLMRLDLDYMDVYYIHWPNPHDALYVEAFQALLDAQKQGLIRSIGVSNFLPEHIERLQAETGKLPVLNQLELHPEYNQATEMEENKKHQIQTVAWSPLGRKKALSLDVIQEIAKNRGRTPAQIILRWHIQRQVLPIPKSANSQRQQENIAVFDFKLTEEEMTLITGLSHEKGRRKNRHPAEHHEY